MKLYVGNLSYSTGESDLRDLFAAYGAVESVAVITDRDSGRSKGFGFVELGDGSGDALELVPVEAEELDRLARPVGERRLRHAVERDMRRARRHCGGIALVAERMVQLVVEDQRQAGQAQEQQEAGS